MPEPVYLTPYDPLWPTRFEEERGRIEGAIGPWVAETEHVGSTAVPAVDAKSVIDIMVGLVSMSDADHCVEPLASLGYSYWEEGVEPHHRLFVMFVDARRTARTHNLHLVEAGGWYWKERLLFRNYLRNRPAVADQYAQLKHKLAKQHRDDREAYTTAKAEFVSTIVREAKESRS